MTGGVLKRLIQTLFAPFKTVYPGRTHQSMPIWNELADIPLEDFMGQLRVLLPPLESPAQPEIFRVISKLVENLCHLHESGSEPEEAALLMPDPECLRRPNKDHESTHPHEVMEGSYRKMASGFQNNRQDNR
jgi:hypothetical protein